MVSGDYKVCGVCYGTGFVDSYRFCGGMRLALDARTGTILPNVSITLNGVDIDNTQYPNCFRFNLPSQNVTWTVELPYFINVIRLRVLDNTKDASDKLVIEGFDALDVGGGSWAAIDESWFLGRSSHTVQVRVRPADSSLMTILTFTHLELIFQQREAIYVQIPQLQKALNTDQAEAVISTEFELEPTITSLTRESILEVPGQGLLFRIIEVTNKSTSSGSVFGVVGTIRVIQPSEKNNLFRIGSEKDPTLHPYRGNELVQGGIRPTLPVTHDHDDCDSSISIQTTG
jgi:hypothetical protein